MERQLIVLLLTMWAALACAAVPKESVELSATVGRDLAVVHASHREVVDVLFARMRRDVNRFVDEVYGPWQIQTVMQWQRKITAGELPQQKQFELMPRLNDALKQGATPEQQRIAFATMGAIVGRIRNDIEAMRHDLLTPLEAQQSEVLGAIDSAYEQIHYANSIVTGHLASVVEVHDAQDELFAKAGVSKNLRSDVGTTLAEASEQISNLVDQAANADNKIGDASQKAQALKATLGDLGTRLVPPKGPPVTTERPNAK